MIHYRAIALGAMLWLVSCGASGPDCQRTDVDVFGLQEIEATTACAQGKVENLTLVFVPIPDADDGTCEPGVIFLAPNGFELPRVDLSLVVGDTRMVATSVAVRDYLFTDRLSNSTEMWTSPDESCGSLSVTVDAVRCRVSAEATEDYFDCGPVTFAGTDMFSSFSGQNN